MDENNINSIMIEEQEDELSELFDKKSIRPKYNEKRPNFGTRITLYLKP